MWLLAIYIVLFSSLQFAIRGQNVNSTTSLSKPAGVNAHSKTFPALVLNAEGGSVSTDDLSFKILNNVDHSVNNQNSHVKPRKEALIDTKSPETGLSSEKDLKDKNNTSKPSQPELSRNPTTMPIESIKNVKQPTNTEVKVNKPTPHEKKPTLLSYDRLHDVPNSIIKSKTLQDLKSSSNPIDSGQIPSPNQEMPNNSFYSNIAARNPSMVIPIVISLLMLPVVAVLGYVGLKKGKEAWKNRHYKRMDFLLDGMYNE